MDFSFIDIVLNASTPSPFIKFLYENSFSVEKAEDCGMVRYAILKNDYVRLYIIYEKGYVSAEVSSYLSPENYYEIHLIFCYFKLANPGYREEAVYNVSLDIIAQLTFFMDSYLKIVELFSKLNFPSVHTALKELRIRRGEYLFPK